MGGRAIWRSRPPRARLEVGKLADLVILDKNPLKVDPMAIKDIKVVETIKEGQHHLPGTRRRAKPATVAAEDATRPTAGRPISATWPTSTRRPARNGR